MDHEIYATVLYTTRVFSIYSKFAISEERYLYDNSVFFLRQ